MVLLWPECALILLASAFLSILAGLVYRMLRTRKPDPHMTLLLALLKDLPKDQNSGSGGSGTPDHSECDEDLGPLGPGGFGSLALYDSGRNTAGGPSHLLGSSCLDERNPQRVVLGNRLPASGSGNCASPRAGFHPLSEHPLFTSSGGGARESSYERQNLRVVGAPARGSSPDGATRA
jgi:hypothetical protein